MYLSHGKISLLPGVEYKHFEDSPQGIRCGQAVWFVCWLGQDTRHPGDFGSSKGEFSKPLLVLGIFTLSQRTSKVKHSFGNFESYRVLKFLRRGSDTIALRQRGLAFLVFIHLVLK